MRAGFTRTFRSGKPQFFDENNSFVILLSSPGLLCRFQMFVKLYDGVILGTRLHRARLQGDSNHRLRRVLCLTKIMDKSSF